MAKQDSKNDLERSGRVNTKVSTVTVVEDRTNEPVSVLQTEYHSSDEIVGEHGTVVTTYGEPVGGFLEADADA